MVLKLWRWLPTGFCFNPILITSKTHKDRFILQQERCGRNWPSLVCLYSNEQLKSDTHLRSNNQVSAHTFYTAAPSKRPRWLCRERKCCLGTESHFPYNAHTETYKKPTGSKQGNLPWCHFNKMPAFWFSHKPSFPEDRLLLFLILMVLSSFQYTPLCNCLVTYRKKNALWIFMVRIDTAAFQQLCQIWANDYLLK